MKKKKTSAVAASYTGAGFLFYSNKHFLTGFSSHLQKWSGFGGKREPEDKSALHTAIRELLEELFAINPSEMLIKWLSNIKILATYNRHSYVLYICDIKELKWISAVLMFFGEKSPYYTYLPTEMNELLTERNAPNTAEVPRIEIMHESTISSLPQADHHFLKDIRIVLGEDSIVDATDAENNT
jgi:hypothetical protein